MLLSAIGGAGGLASASAIVLVTQWALPAMPATISPLYVVLSLVLAVADRRGRRRAAGAQRGAASSRSTRCAPSDSDFAVHVGSIAMWTVLRASLAAAVLAVAGLHAPCAAAETVAMIGTGNVGAALGRRFAENGHKIVYGSRDPSAADVRELVAATGNGAVAVTQAEAAAQADIVVLAVPWTAAEDVVRALPDLRGKIVVDPTNPRVMASDGFADYPIEDSNAERIARLAPGAHVVKAFSTLGAETMLDPKLAGGPVTVPVVGDDRAAKERIARWPARSGSRPSTSARCATRASSRACITCAPMLYGGRINYHLPRDTARD